MINKINIPIFILWSLFFLIFYSSNNISYAADDEVDISMDPSSNLQVDEKTQSNLKKKLNLEGEGCITLPTNNCGLRLICYTSGEVMMDAKRGIYRPRWIARTAKDTYRKARSQYTFFLNGLDKIDGNKCKDKFAEFSVNGGAEEEGKLGELCDGIMNESTSASRGETIGLVNVAYVFNSKTGQLTAAVGSSCESRDVAKGIKQDLQNNSPRSNNKSGGATKQNQNGAESSEYFNEDF